MDALHTASVMRMGNRRIRFPVTAKLHLRLPGQRREHLPGDANE